MTQVESALQNARIEYVEESTEGTTPPDPTWSTFTDYLTELSASPNADREGQMVVGSGDYFDHFRGTEEPEFTTQYYKQQDFVSSGPSENYPAAYVLTYDHNSEYPSFTFEYRRETTDGGNDGAGFREYALAQGAKPVGVTLPGDPSASEPVIEELSWQARKFRTYVIHQPSSSTTVDVENTGSNSVDVTIEDEGAATSETITVAGGSTVTTTATFDNIDVIHAESEPDGDILVTDGSGTTLLEGGLVGSSTDNVEGDRGLPPLGSGSHGSAIGTDPDNYMFAGVDVSGIQWDSGDLSQRVHTLDLNVELDVSREAIAGTRQSTIDIGPRSTQEVSADLGGPHETADLLYEHWSNKSGNFVWSFEDNDLQLTDAEIIDAPDFTRSAGETNYLPSVTLEGEGVSVSYTGP